MSQNGQTHFKNLAAIANYSWDVSFTLTKEVVKKQLETIVKNHWDFLIIFFQQEHLKDGHDWILNCLKYYIQRYIQKKAVNFCELKTCYK